MTTWFSFLRLTDIPEPVVITEAINEDGKITLKWQKPEENGAAIIQYSKYQRIADEEQWTNRENITDTDKRSYVFKVKKGEKYEFVMTATNNYGESEKTYVQEVEVLAGKHDFSSFCESFYPRKRQNVQQPSGEKYAEICNDGGKQVWRKFLEGRLLKMLM